MFFVFPNGRKRKRLKSNSNGACSQIVNDNILSNKFGWTVGLMPSLQIYIWLYYQMKKLDCLCAAFNDYIRADQSCRKATISTQKIDIAFIFPCSAIIHCNRILHCIANSIRDFSLQIFGQLQCFSLKMFRCGLSKCYRFYK